MYLILMPSLSFPGIFSKLFSLQVLPDPIINLVPIKRQKKTNRKNSYQFKKHLLRPIFLFSFEPLLWYLISSSAPYHNKCKDICLSCWQNNCISCNYHRRTYTLLLTYLLAIMHLLLQFIIFSHTTQHYSIYPPPGKYKYLEFFSKSLNFLLILPAIHL